MHSFITILAFLGLVSVVAAVPAPKPQGYGSYAPYGNYGSMYILFHMRRRQHDSVATFMLDDHLDLIECLMKLTL